MADNKLITKNNEFDRSKYARCHNCGEIKEREKFYMSRSRKIINTFKCKKCYRDEFIKILKEAPL